MLKGKDPRWREVLQRLRLLARLEIITCPFSSIQRDESLVADGLRDDLKHLYRELSGGVRFLDPFEIEQRQLIGAMRRWLSENDVDASWTKPRPWREFCKSDPHQWQTGQHIFADFPFNRGMANRVTTEKHRLHDSLGSVSQHWRQEKGRFDAVARAVAIGYGNAVLDMYDECARRPERIVATAPAALQPVLEHFFAPDRFDPSRPPGIQPAARLVHHLMGMIQETRRGYEYARLRGAVEQFFASDHATGVPFIDIASRLWAVVAEHACNPKGQREIGAGDANDVMVISRYAPYCDAMIVDKTFCNAATRGEASVASKYGVAMFSAKTLPLFVAYLDALLGAVTPDHLEALRDVYPELRASKLHQASRQNPGTAAG